MNLYRFLCTGQLTHWVVAGAVASAAEDEACRWSRCYWRSSSSFLL